MRKHILFDLDGTLTDPGVGITSSVAYALEAFGIHVEDLSSLNCFIGPPLWESFRVYYGLSESDAHLAVEKYRERFSTVGLFENELYEGVPQMLARLRDAGCVLAVATSKPTVFASRILDHFSLSPYFNYALGSELDGRRVDKAEVVAEVMAQLGATAADTLMVGDRKHDVLGAASCGIPALGVLYGYGDEQELTLAGAAALVSHPADIPDCIRRLD